MEIVSVVEIMAVGSRMPCFASGGTDTLRALKERFGVSQTEAHIHALVERMVDQSIASYRTSLYDNFQYYTNGILL